jgi:hypothetical protein
MNISFRAIQESLKDSITQTGTVLFTNEKNMYIVKSDGSKLKISDNVFVENEEELSGLTEKFKDKIYVVKDSWKMYSWDGETWKLLSGGGGSGGSGGSISETARGTVNATQDQEIIRSPFSFPLGGSLKLYRNGVLQNLGVDYTELSTNSIQVTNPASSTDVFTFMLEVSGSLKLEPTAYRLELIYNVDGNVEKEVYTGGVNKTVTYTYNSTTGNIMTKTVEKDGLVTTATYNYDTEGNLISVDDEGTELVLVTDSSVEGDIGTVKPLNYHVDIVYNDSGKVDSEIYTGSVNKTVVYEYDEVSGKVLSKTVTSGDSVLKSTYTYDENGALISIDDEGTELVIVEGSNIGQDGDGSGGTVDPIIVDRVDTIDQTLTNHMTMMEEQMRRNQLNMINMQIKYDMALDMVGNQCGDYFIDVLQNSDNIETMINCSFDSLNEVIR